MASNCNNDAPPCKKSSRPLHVILEHRNEAEFNSYLRSLRTKAPAKLTLFSDFQWIESGQLITRNQRDRLFDTLGDIAHGLKALQMDFLCDLYLSDAEMDLLLANSRHHHNLPVEEESVVERLQVLPCTLITRLLRRAPQLESLALKELWLSGSPSEVDELVQCLQSHPKLHKVDLRWKLANTGINMEEQQHQEQRQHCAVLEPLVAGICQMPHLTQLNLMIPHWIPALVEVLPYSTTLSTVKLTVESTSTTTHHQDHMASLIRHWKYDNTTLRHLELSAFDIMQQTGPALVELLQDNPHLQHLAVVDHNIFSSSRRRPSMGGSDSTTMEEPMANARMTTIPSFTAEQLVAALQTNTALKRLQLISKTSTSRINSRRLSNDSHAASERGRDLFAQLLETNLNLEQISISHGKLHLSAPVLSGEFGGPTISKDNQQQTQFPVDALDFYLRLNQDGYRRPLLLASSNCDSGTDNDSGSTTKQDMVELWQPVIQKYHQDTASLFALLQGCPSIVSVMHVCDNGVEIQSN